MKRNLRQLALFMFIALACSLSLSGWASAQEVTGTITGTVLDPNGASVPGAKVILTSSDRGFERAYETNDEGIFSAPLLPPGAYSLTIEVAGFKNMSKANIQISVNDRRPVEVRLEAGGITETVNVTADASIIQESPTQRALIEGSQVRQLPLNNRNFVQLATLAPGVTSSNSSQIGFGGLAVVQISINGGRTSAINWLVDGSRNVDSGSNLTLLTVPSVDAIQEFTVLTSNYAPEFGRNGGGVVNVVTRQGTNDYHGTLYEFVRNDVFNARDPFITTRIPGLGSATDPRFKQPLRYNDFGGTIGGPVHFLNFGEGGPTVYNGRDRTFFFFHKSFAA
ncbi:MAG: carboxypeptidase regulatory-like domain-containing protein [Pyrinomonadaceae bacterium]